MKRLATLLLFSAALFAQGPTGIWDAFVLLPGGKEVPFRVEFSGAGDKMTCALLDGDARIKSTKGSFREDKITFRWDYYDADLVAAFEGGREFRGVYTRRGRAGIVKYAFFARPYKAQPEGQASKSAAGDWIFETEGQGAKGVIEARFRQSGAEVTGTMQRVDGDFGTLAGRVRGERVVLSHFDGIRATLVELQFDAKGSLAGTINGTTKIRGARASEAARLGIKEPPDPSRYTNVDDPSKPVVFTGKTLDGKPVSSEDPQFKGKGIIVTIMGSWCPNCHDEAVLLADLYKRHKARGLEVVALGFEYTGEFARDAGQLRAFSRRHATPYTVLLAGTADDGQVPKAIPQLKGFGAYPTTLFLDRQHRAVSVHAGFSGPATGAEYEKLKREFESLARKITETK
jgi:thiol-disulfide isomerase/thioredoxin